LIDMEFSRAYKRSSEAPESAHREYSGLARGKKRIKSLLELMDSESDYQTPAQTGSVVPKPAEQPKGEKTTEKKSAEKPAVKKEPKKEAEQEYATEPLLALGDGNVRLVLNYPLAVMVCFVVVIAVICAVLVGWKLGQERTEKRYGAWISIPPEKIDREIPGIELEKPAESLDR
jgi:hypothetical protein